MTRDYITIDVCLDEFSDEQIKAYVIKNKIDVLLDDPVDVPPDVDDFIETATQIIRRGDAAALVEHVSTYIKDVTGRAVV